MNLDYFPDTDSLYIDLSSRPSVDSVEVPEGIVLDYDDIGRLVGIDIDEASRKAGPSKVNYKSTAFQDRKNTRVKSNMN